ncbi:hypothetical protein [Bradyrhizobium septentrionale]|uniref:Uncharacterized protein n=1 Tax=Bradyrhizobium septentrionale TaxID=1404411 RepID=A0ABZ2P169_9BRAD|nr:hypothetical protein [Bradyrhizobium septentrionale]
MTTHGQSQRLALTAHLLGLGTGVTVIVGLVPATLALLRALI